MQYVLFFFLAISLTLQASKEFPYIQPVAVEYAPASKVKPTPRVPKITPPRVIKKKKTEPIVIPDSDKDGVFDKNDNCPNTPKNFVVDSSGCPQTATLEVTFDSDSYIILENRKEDLKEFARFLDKNRGYQVVIYGYTDSIGRAEKNKILSHKRANAVKEALINYGVSSTRLTAIGRGEENPKASNMYHPGRQLNRRIEVELME